ncbi:unnamed protein product [Aureobasidium uvarum]|uniref:ubiquitinyl hydrolase 1 n=1 Tax=Aureobasidium uvarum TaxID=2773716 RepID=A0A9N8KS82_9PEZI|nr:unnamed protein product [Aureobasidium uvarum]
MPQRTYSKTFTPLESNPEIFTSLSHSLGLCTSLIFHEVYSLDEQCFDGRVLAYTLAFPTSDTYDDERAAQKPGLRRNVEDGISEGQVKQEQEEEEEEEE